MIKPTATTKTPLSYAYSVCFAFDNPYNNHDDKVEIFLTAAHASRIPAVTNTIFFIDPDERMELEKKFSILWKEKLNIEVREHKNTFKTKCLLYDVQKGFISCGSYGFIENIEGYGTIMVIPESMYAKKLLMIAKMKGMMPVLFKQPEINLMPWKPPTHKDVQEGFFVDTSSRNRYSKNVIPRYYPSLIDLKLNPEMFKGTPFYNLIDLI